MIALLKCSKISLFLGNVSRETIRVLYGCLLLLVVFATFIGCGEDSISEDISGFNQILASKYDIASAEELARFYHDFLYDNEQGKFTFETSPQTHNRVRVIMINHNPVHQNMAAEKFELVVKQNETTWKMVVVNRNWKCKGSEEWGIEVCN